MRKSLKLLLFLGLLAYFPVSAHAIYEEDEKGNQIIREIGDDEVRITEFLDDGSAAPDTPVSSDERDRLREENSSNYQDVVEGNDLVFTTQEDALLTSGTVDNDNNLLYIIISGLSGVVVGGLLTYFVILKR